MKKLITPLAVIAICTTCLLIVLSFFDFAVYRWLILGVSVSLFVVLSLLMFGLMKLIMTWTQKIDVVSPSPIKTIWETRNVAAIETQFENIIRKFELSASGIATLGQTGEAVHIDDLIRNDAIGKAILSVREEMLQLKGVEEKRNWITQGLARFSEILRRKNEIKEYSQHIISNLVKYLGANQGGLFLERSEGEEERFLELAACYAYGRQKMIEKKIVEGQGLLGQCMLEMDIIFLTSIPCDYVSITSGLGEATPRNVIVVPLISNEKFYGAIELASFSILQPFQIEFLSEVCKNIAAEFSSIRSIQATRKLLDESEALTEELQFREDEMRHHMEQLVVSQESMERNQWEIKSYLAAIDNTMASASFDLTGKFLLANEIFLQSMGYELKDLERTDYRTLMCDEESSQRIWENLRHGKFFSGDFRMQNRTGRQQWFSGTFNPISAGEGKIDKVMMFAHLTTREKDGGNELQILVNAFKASLPVAEFNENFVCKSANDKFMNLFGLTRMSVKGKGFNDFIESSYHSLFDRIKGEILATDSSYLILPMITISGATTYEVSVHVSRDPETLVHRIIVLLIKEVSEEKVHVLNTVTYGTGN